MAKETGWLDYMPEERRECESSKEWLGQGFLGVMRARLLKEASVTRTKLSNMTRTMPRNS